MATWQLTFYNAKVQAQIERWPAGIRASFLRIAQVMQAHGPDLGMPHTRAMGAGLFEVRAKGREGIGRAFYCIVQGEHIVILHAIVKKTEKTPARDLDTCTRPPARDKGMTADKYDPVPFDVEATRKRWMKRPAFAEAYNALEDEFATLGELLRARQQAGMTQADVAESMGIAQASVARLESSAGSRKHAPSIATLRRYAEAVGCELHITLAAKAKPKHLATR